MQNGTILPTAFLNLTSSLAQDSEQGLLGLAFPPNYGSSGRFYVCFTNTAGHIVVARFNRSNSNPLVANTASGSTSNGRTVIDSSFIPSRITTAATWRLDPMASSTSAWETAATATIRDHMAQTPGSLLGKMLRLDVSVPDGDPGATPCRHRIHSSGSRATSREIWSFGLRNPWRWSFDDPALGGNGAMLIGDVGQGAREEIDYEPAGRGGRNYGWRNREGTLAQYQPTWHRRFHR